MSLADVLISIRETPKMKFHNYPDPAANFASVGEDVHVGELVSTITVTGGAVVRITEGNQAGLLRLETVGDRHYVRLSRRPEMRTRTEYQLTVEARDRQNSSLVSTASLLVKVDTFPLKGQ